MLIREEAHRDAEAVYAVVSSAFGQPAEAQLVRDLHAAGNAIVALVAEDESGIIAHVLLSRMAAPFPALALAPVSVSPGRQRAGIGSALIREALCRAAGDHWAAVFVLGDPNYYGRFGFSTAVASGFSSPYTGDHFMGLALSGTMPTVTGQLRYAPAFSAL
jgi:putative acetyltransferase